jgi:hypothetical protein
VNFLTFGDAVQHALDYLGSSSGVRDGRDARRAVLATYRDLVNARTWSYLSAHGRVHAVAPYRTGTIAFVLLGRRVLLHGGTWPSWAGPSCHLRVGDVVYAVDERVSDSEITLDANLSPSASFDYATVAITAATSADPIVITSVGHGLATGDTVIIEGVVSSVDGGTVSANGTHVVTVVDDDTFELDDSEGAADPAYATTAATWRLPPTTVFTLYRDVYLLPEDFVAGDTAIWEGNFGGMTYCHPTEWLWENRYTESSGTPHSYTIVGDARFPGRLVLKVWPYPDDTRTIDFVYHRRPRPMVLAEAKAGTVTIAAGATTLAGTGTAFTPAMEGSVIRLGTASDLPTGPEGDDPAAFETVIKQWVSASEVRLAEAPPIGFAAVKYVVSDPVDIEPGSMRTAFTRGVEYQLHLLRQMNDGKRDAFAAWDLALREAKGADSRSLQPRAIGRSGSRRPSFKDMPASFD